MELTEVKISRLIARTIGVVCNNKCKGLGALVEDGCFIDCSCVTEFKDKLPKVKANIPERYWDFSFRNLTKDFSEQNTQSLEKLRLYVKELSKATELGIGLYIQGVSGLAKSALAYHIAQEAIKQDIPVYTITLYDLIETIRSVSSVSLRTYESVEPLEVLLSDLVTKYKLLVIDEIDKPHKVDSTLLTGYRVQKFFADIYDRQISLIATSNTPLDREALSAVYPAGVVDRFLELNPITLVGDSYRVNRKQLSQLKKESN